MSAKTQMRFKSSDAAVAMARDNLCAAIVARINLEAQRPDNASKLKYLERQLTNSRKCDNFTLHYAAKHGIDFVQWYVHSRFGGTHYNIYAMPKGLVVMRILNGSAFEDLQGNDEITVAGTILALQAAGGIIDGKALGFYLDDYMNTVGKRKGYHNGATQSGSSMRALEALGIVKKEGAKCWKVENPAHFQLLVDAARVAYR